MDVRIHGESRYTKGLSHDDRGGLMPNARQFLKFLEGSRDVPSMLGHDQFCQANEGLGLLRC